MLCVLLESPHRGDSYEYTQIYHFQYKKVSYPKFNLCSCRIFFQGTQNRARNNRRKRAISVRATEVLLYNVKLVFSACYFGLGHEVSLCGMIFTIIKIVLILKPRILIYRFNKLQDLSRIRILIDAGTSDTIYSIHWAALIYRHVMKLERIMFNRTKHCSLWLTYMRPCSLW